MLTGVAISALLLALRLVVLHSPEGQIVEVNPDDVVSIRGPREGGEHQFHPDVKCLLYTSDGKTVAVLEDCDTVHQKLTDTLQ